MLTLNQSTGSLNREASIRAIRERRERWDIAIIGGGATGIGIALDAASRGYSAVLVEQADFGKGTSSRSTKLVHGGVRYLAQGDIPLVREALHERGLLLRNATGLAHPLGFVIPAASIAEAAWYRSGIAAYDLLAGSLGIGKSKWLTGREVMTYLPTVRKEKVRAGVLYYDGQFDDARLLIGMARVAASSGAVLLNYARASNVDGRSGFEAIDRETGEHFSVAAKVVINASGAWSEDIRQHAGTDASRLRVSRGSHVVVDRRFLPGSHALLIPKTPDGRVLFAIPWLGHTLIGTTDVETDDAPLEPVPSRAEIDFILETASRYLESQPRRSDVTSTWAGLRPLAAPPEPGGAQRSSANLSRGHAVKVDADGLVNVTGGKWTTYRRMAQDAVDTAAKAGGLKTVACRTESLALRGEAPVTGLRAAVLRAVHDEMARTVEDVLARRTRTLFLNAAEAIRTAPQVAEWMRAELGHNAGWADEQIQAFNKVAAGYLVGSD